MTLLAFDPGIDEQLEVIRHTPLARAIPTGLSRGHARGLWCRRHPH